MKKAVLCLIVLFVAGTALLFLSLPKEQTTAPIRFVGYSSDTNGLKVARLAFTNSLDRPIHYFCRTYNDPTSIGYSLTSRDGSLVTNTIVAASMSGGRLMPQQELVFSVAVPTNANSTLQLNVPYLPENSELQRLIGDLRQMMTQRKGRVVLSAIVDLP